MRRAPLLSLLSGLLGGGVVAAALLLGGVAGRGTVTVVEQAPLGRGALAAAEAGTQTLTPHQIYELDAAGVAYVSSQIVQQVVSPFDLFPQDQQSTATGSGFVIDHKGDILTNAHVVDGASRVTVSLENGRPRPATVVGKDNSTDIALLRIDPHGLVLHPLALGDSSRVQVGDPTVAIGNPFDLQRTLTTGVVSALQRQLTAPDGFSIDNVIQTDAPINPGNSGGPLIDASGRVIGINSQIETTGAQAGSIGIGFAVPIDTAKRVLPGLEHAGTGSAGSGPGSGAGATAVAAAGPGFLGVTGVTIDGALARVQLAASSGVLVQSVEPGSAAQRAGIQGGGTPTTIDGQTILLGGDIIVAIDGQVVTSFAGLRRIVGSHKAGQTIAITLLRAGQRRRLTVTLGSAPAQ